MEGRRRIVLPTKKHRAKGRPLSILVLGLPKVGKTSFLGTAEDILVIDVDNGADFLDGIYLWKPRSLTEIRAVLSEPLPRIYKVIAIDSLTMLVHMLERETVERWQAESLADIPYGRGYADVRRGVTEIIQMAQRQGRWLIGTAHLFVAPETTTWTPEMSGRLRMVVSALFDCIAQLQRAEDGEAKLVFSPKEAGNPEVGSRHPALAGKTLPARFDAILEEVRRWEEGRPKEEESEEEEEGYQLELVEEKEKPMTERQKNEIRELYNALVDKLAAEGKQAENGLVKRIVLSQHGELTYDEAEKLIAELREKLREE